MEEQPDWTRWWQDNVPCLYSPARALENAAYLREVLGEKFITLSRHPVSQIRNPILQRWRTNGANAFIELNALAEDLRVVDAAENFDDVIRDLRRTETCLATWHCAHVAAMFSRPPESSIEKFFRQTDVRSPDFMFLHEGKPYVAEAKQLGTSAIQEAFQEYSAGIVDRVLSEVLSDETFHPDIFVAIKDATMFPEPDLIVAAVKLARTQFVDRSIVAKSELFNVIVEPRPDHNAMVISPRPRNRVERSCSVFAPRSPREDLRIHRPSQKASTQLDPTAFDGAPGVLALALTPLNDAIHVAQLFRDAFARGQYRGISWVVLLNSGVQGIQPIRAPLDLITAVENVHRSRRDPGFGFRAVGVRGHHPRAVEGEVPVYAARNYSTVYDGEGQRLFVPDLRRVPVHVFS